MENFMGKSYMDRAITTIRNVIKKGDFDGFVNHILS